MLAFVGLSVNALMLFLAQFGAGVSKSSSISVHGSLMADQYPIGLRGRLSAITNFANQSATAFSPLVMAGIAALVGGASGWRWSFLVMVVPVALASCIAFRLPEPVRGRQEKGSVLGEVFADDRPAPISIEAAFERLKRIRTLKTVVLGFAALGFGLFTGPVLSNLFLQQHYHLGTFDRGIAATIQNAAAAGPVAFCRASLRPALSARSGVWTPPAGAGDFARSRPGSSRVLHAQLAALRRAGYPARHASGRRLRHDRTGRHVDRSLPAAAVSVSPLPPSTSFSSAQLVARWPPHSSPTSSAYARR